MKKTLYILLFIYSCSIVLCAQKHEISPLDAANIIRLIESQEADLKSSTQRETENQLIVDKTSYSGKSHLYVVQKETGGYYIVSSIDQTKPILMVSETGYFSNTIPEAMKDLLCEYELEIAYIHENNIDIPIDSEWKSYFNNDLRMLASNASSDSVVLTKLNDVSWNQSGNNSGGTQTNIYNLLCPLLPPSQSTEYNCGHAYAGCTAVAMAQVMWYWEWPYAAAVPNQIDSRGNYSNDNHTQIYNWSKMPTKLKNNTAIDAALEVQTLLRDCGYVAQMKYGADGSGASLFHAKQGLEMFFRYDGVTHRRKATTANWESKLIAEIDAGRPIIYAGFNPNNLSSGHSFVVYGYNPANRTFKINWGWGNASKQWCTLGSIVTNPPRNYNFSSRQEALFGIEPNVLCTNYVKSALPDQQTVFLSGGFYDLFMVINANHSLVCCSGDRIRLLPGFYAHNGSNVYLGMRNFPCGRNVSAIIASPSTENPQTEIEPDLSEYNSELGVYPNPSSNIVHIGGINTEDIKTFIYTTLGELVIETTELQIDISALPKGLYIIVCKEGVKQHHCSFIKK